LGEPDLRILSGPASNLTAAQQSIQTRHECCKPAFLAAVVLVRSEEANAFFIGQESDFLSLRQLMNATSIRINL